MSLQQAAAVNTAHRARLSKLATDLAKAASAESSHAIHTCQNVHEHPCGIFQPFSARVYDYYFLCTLCLHSFMCVFLLNCREGRPR